MSGITKFDMIVRFNSKVFWHIENVEKIRYGMLLSFNSFNLPCHKVKLTPISVTNKIEIDIPRDVIKREYILSTFDEVYYRLVFVHKQLQQYLINKHQLLFTSNKLYKIKDKNKIELIQLKGIKN